MNADVMLFADANTGGEQFCSYVRIKGITVSIFLHGYGSGLTGLFEKCRRPTYKIRIITYHLLLACQFAHPTLDMQRQGTG